MSYENSQDRWLVWLEAYRAETSGDLAKAARLYKCCATMFGTAALPHHEAHFAEMAKICELKGEHK